MVCMKSIYFAACAPYIGSHNRNLCPEQTSHPGHHPALALFQKLAILPAAPNHHAQKIHIEAMAAYSSRTIKL